LSLKQVANQQVEGAAMLDYADLDVECLERRGTHGQHMRDYVPTEYADIDFSRPARTNRGNNSQYADQERVVFVVHESAEYSNF